MVLLFLILYINMYKEKYNLDIINLEYLYKIKSKDNIGR